MAAGRQSREARIEMRLVRLLPVLALMALGLIAAACSSATPTPTATPVPMATPTETDMMGTPMPMATATPAMMDNVQRLVSGWYNGREVRYYDFGMNSPVADGVVQTAPIYAFVTGFDMDGNPMFVEGQHNVVTTVPGVDGYSDLWKVNLVVVPEGYVPDSITSKAQIDASGYEVMPTDILVNCPIVNQDTVFEGGEDLVQGWYNGVKVYYPDFGMNPATTAPIWAFITGFDSDGNPMFVKGQHNVINVVPGDAGYSAFWSVNLVMVPSDYVPDSIRDVQSIFSSGYQMVQPGLVVNCPVTFVAAS